MFALRVVLHCRWSRADIHLLPYGVRCHRVENRRPRCAKQLLLKILRLSEQRIRTWQNRQSQGMVCHPRTQILRLNARLMMLTRRLRVNLYSWAPECLLVRQLELQSGRQWPGPSVWLWAEQLGRSLAQLAALRRDRYAKQEKNKAKRGELGLPGFRVAEPLRRKSLTRRRKLGGLESA